MIDLSRLNKHITAPRFRMETSRSVRNSVNQGEYAVSIDLSDAYLHVPMHKASQKYLRFAIDNHVYTFVALPFGLNLDPWIFTTIMEMVMCHVRKVSLSSVTAYPDDILLKY